MGARITAHLSQANNRYSSCIILNTTQDLAAGRMESVVMSGPTQSGGDYCNLSAPADIIRVMVVPSSGPGGFRTGTPSLPHLPVFYELTE